MRRIRLFLQAIGRISEWTGKTAGIVVAMLTFVIMYEIIARYVFNAPTVWAHELTTFIYGACWILAGAYALQEQAHVNMNIIYDRLSPRGKAIMDVVTSTFFFLFCGALLWKGAGMAWHSIKMLETSGTNWDPPIYPLKIALFLGAFLIVVEGVAKLVRDLIIAFGGTDAS